MVAPRPRLAVLLIVLGAPALAHGLGGLDDFSRWEGGGSVHAGQADRAQGLQMGFASRLQGLQEKIVGQFGAASGSQGLAAELSSGIEGLRGKLARLKGRLAQESDYWDSKARESWQDGLALLTSAQQLTKDAPQPVSGRWGCWESVRANLTSVRQWLQEELSLRTDRLQDRFAQVQGNLTSALQLNLTLAQAQGNLTFARLLEGGLSSHLAGNLAWLKGRFEQESGHWGQRIRESWQAAADSWHGKRRGAKEPEASWRELKLAREESRSWKCEAMHARRRAEEPEEELDTAREVARAREDAAQNARMARRLQTWQLEGNAVQARQAERPRGEVQAREGATEGLSAGNAQLCEERLAEEEEAENGEAAPDRHPHSHCRQPIVVTILIVANPVTIPSFVWGCLCCLCCIWLCLLARRRSLVGAWGRVTSCRRLTSSAQTTQDECDREFPSDVHDEAESDGTRRRILKLQCRGVQHEDISVESICHGCAMAIAQREARACLRPCRRQLSEGLLSLVDALARFEHGSPHPVLRESLPQGRAVRLPQHFRLDGGDACSEWSSEGSEVSGDLLPSDAASVDSWDHGWEKVEVTLDWPPPCPDRKEGSPEGRPGAGPL